MAGHFHKVPMELATEYKVTISQHVTNNPQVLHVYASTSPAL